MSCFSWSMRGLINLVLQVHCPLCQRSTPANFCQSCQRQVQQCQLPIAQWQSDGPLSILAWGHYGGALKRTIAVLKYHNQPQLARPLGQWLGDIWLPLAQPGAANPIVVPIPMHTQKRQQRGFNQAERLAEQFCERTRLRYQPHGLVRSRETTAQFELSAVARAQNLAGAFAIGTPFRQRPPSEPVLLLDDIYTTGATARSAAQTLRQHGIRVYGLIVVARATRA